MAYVSNRFSQVYVCDNVVCVFVTPCRSGVLMCTDVMGRGVDIPEVNWVIQYDPPSSARLAKQILALNEWEN